MTNFVKYEQDLEDAFKLDCSDEDLKTDKDAKRCFKVLKKYRKQTRRYYNFLRKIGIVTDFQYNNKKFKREMEIYNMSERSNNSSSGGGIGFVGVLTIVFIILKLCNVINWSWLWVLAPMWISVALWLMFFVVYFIIGAIIASKRKRFK